MKLNDVTIQICSSQFDVAQRAQKMFDKMIIKKVNSLGATEWNTLYFIPLPEMNVISSHQDMSQLKGI